jgi:hypothetical protein
MHLVAQASTGADAASPRPDAEVDDVIVRVLFEDIVRHLTAPVAVRDPEPGERPEPAEEGGGVTAAWFSSTRVHPGRARSPPRSS